VEDVGNAHPRIVEAVETMVQKGKWTVPGMCAASFMFSLVQAMVPGYKEKFGDLSLM